MSVVIEPPARLPVDYLSVSSVNTFIKCPEQWRRKYLERQFEPPSGQMIVGSCAGAAEGHNYQGQVDGDPGLSSADVLDLYSDEWKDRTDRDDIQWGDSKPVQLRESGEKALAVYHERVAPSVRPVSVEREFNLAFPGVEWGFKGFLDLEEEDGAVCDLKVKGKRLSEHDAAVDLQPAAYLLYRRAIDEPAPEFRYHVMVRKATPEAYVLPTTRTDAQLDAFVDRLFAIAKEMAWRVENDVWSGAVPGSWWCSQRFCGFWHSCPMGGAR